MDGKESNIYPSGQNVPGAPNTDIKWVTGIMQATKESYEGNLKDKYIFDEQALFPTNLSDMENKKTDDPQALGKADSFKTGLSNDNTAWVTTLKAFQMKKPLQITWAPKEDVTTYELAKCLDVILCRTPIMPYDIDINEQYMRHFNIIDPNN